MIRKMILFFCGLIIFSQFVYSQLELAWKKTLPNLVNIGAVKFSNDSKMLLCQVADLDTMYLFDVESGSELKSNIPIMYQPTFSTNDEFLYGVKGQHIYKYSLLTEKDESKFEPMDDPTNIPILNTIMSRDQKYFLATTKTGFKVWDVETGKIIKSKEFDSDSAKTKSYSQINISCDNSEIFVYEDKKYLVGMDSKGQPIYRYEERVYRLDFNTLAIKGYLHNWKTGDTSSVLASFMLSDDCELIALKYAGSLENPLRIYNFKTMELISSMAYATHLKFTSDNKYLVTASSQGNYIAIWDIITGKQLNKRSGSSYNTLDVSGNNQYIASSIGWSLSLIKFSTSDINTNEPIEEVIYPNPSTGMVNIEINLPIHSVLTATISDLSGRFLGELYKKEAREDKNTIQLNLQNYPNGTYFVTLNAVNYKKQFKIIINR